MFEFAAIALFLGIKHSFDADHLVAVSNLLSRAGSLKSAVKMSASWAIGHMITAVLVTVVLFLARDSVLPLILEKLEMAAAVMLILLGLMSIYQARSFHSHEHSHNGGVHSHMHLHTKGNEGEHAHRHMLGIGIIHGLASNDELLILLTVSLGLANLMDMIIGVAIFSVGVIMGMVVFGAFMTYSMLKIESQKLVRIVNSVVGAVSIIYGVMMILSF